MSKTPLFSVYVAQAGAHVRTILPQAEADKLWQALYIEGIPAMVWTRDDHTSRSTGICVVPRRGGWVLNMEPAQAIPARPDNQTPLTEHELHQLQMAQQQIPGWIQPEALPSGAVVLPKWAAEERDGYSAMAALAEGLLAEGAPELGPADVPRINTAAASLPRPPGPGNGAAHEYNNAPPANASTRALQEYAALQARARELGISPLTQKAEELRAAIAEKEAGAVTSPPAA